jgi:hypothetical protein
MMHPGVGVPQAQMQQQQQQQLPMHLQQQGVMPHGVNPLAMMGNQLPPGMQQGGYAAAPPMDPYLMAELADRVVALEEQVEKLTKQNQQIANSITSLMCYLMSVSAILFDKVYKESPAALIQKCTNDVHSLMEQMASQEAAATAAASAASAADATKGIPASVTSFEFSME